MNPVSPEMLTGGEPMRGQENMTVGPVSLDMAQRAMSDQNHERSCRIERYGTSPHV